MEILKEIDWKEDAVVLVKEERKKNKMIKKEKNKLCENIDIIKKQQRQDWSKLESIVEIIVELEDSIS